MAPPAWTRARTRAPKEQASAVERRRRLHSSQLPGRRNFATAAASALNTPARKPAPPRPLEPQLLPKVRCYFAEFPWKH